MSSAFNISYSVAVILQTLANGYPYGFDIMDITGLPSGTVYPALRRLEDAGLVNSKWERVLIAHQEQRPPRRYYVISKKGKEALAEAVKRYKLLDQTVSKATIKPKLSSN